MADRHVQRWPALLLGLLLANCHQQTTSVETPCVADSLLERELPTLSARLQRDVSSRSGAASTEPEAGAFVARIRQLHTPGLVALLAAGTPAAQRQGVTLGESLSRQDVEQELLKAGERMPVRVPGVQVLAVSKKEVEQAGALLESGRFAGDLREFVATAIDAGFAIQDMDGGALLRAILQDGPGALSREWLCLEGLRKAGCTWTEFPMAAKSLLTTGKVRDRQLFQDTLRVLTGEVGGPQVSNTMTRLLHNETVRLAIVVYARSQGVSITDEQVKEVGQFFDPQSSQQGNVAVLLTPAVSGLTSRYHGDKVLMALDRLGSARSAQGCRPSGPSVASPS